MSTPAPPPPFPAVMAPQAADVPHLVAFSDSRGIPTVVRGTSLEAWLTHREEVRAAAIRDELRKEIAAEFAAQTADLIATALKAHDNCVYRIAGSLAAIPDEEILSSEVARTRIGLYVPDPVIAAFQANARRAGLTFSDAATVALAAWNAVQELDRAQAQGGAL